MMILDSGLLFVPPCRVHLLLLIVRPMASHRRKALTSNAIQSTEQFTNNWTLLVKVVQIQ